MKKLEVMILGLHRESGTISIPEGWIVVNIQHREGDSPYDQCIAVPEKDRWRNFR